MASTNRPGGMVHSIAALVSSVASAKYSADAGGWLVAATRVVGAPSHRDSAALGRCSDHRAPAPR